MIELNDDEIILAVKAQKIVEEKLSTYRYDPNDFAENKAMMSWIADTFDKVAGLEVSVIMREVNVPVSSSTIQSVYMPDVQVIGRTGAGEKIDAALKTQTDWERKAYDAKKHSIEDLDKLTDGQAAQLID